MENLEMDQRMKNLAEKLRLRGQRLTPQRMSVLRVLTADKNHFTVDQVYAEVRKSFPMVSLATIYKTLYTLQAIGEVNVLNLNDTAPRYDGYDPQPHPHLMCISCKKITDLEEIKMEPLKTDISAQTGYQIVGQDIEIYGICPACQGKNQFSVEE